MALFFLRAFFILVSAGIAVLIINHASLRSAAAWVPWGILTGMIALPLTVIGIDGAIRRKDLTIITAIYFGLLIGVFLTYITMLALTPVLPLNQADPLWSWLPLILGGVLLAQTGVRRGRARTGAGGGQGQTELFGSEW